MHQNVEETSLDPEDAPCPRLGAVSVCRSRNVRDPLPMLARDPAGRRRRTKQPRRRRRDSGDVPRRRRPRAAALLRRRRRRARPGLSELRRRAVIRFVAGADRRRRAAFRFILRPNRGGAGRFQACRSPAGPICARRTEGVRKRPATWPPRADPPRHAAVRLRSRACRPLLEGACPPAGVPRGTTLTRSSSATFPSLPRRFAHDWKRHGAICRLRVACALPGPCRPLVDPSDDLRRTTAVRPASRHALRRGSPWLQPRRPKRETRTEGRHYTYLRLAPGHDICIMAHMFLSDSGLISAVVLPRVRHAHLSRRSFRATCFALAAIVLPAPSIAQTPAASQTQSTSAVPGRPGPPLPDADRHGHRAEGA